MTHYHFNAFLDAAASGNLDCFMRSMASPSADDLRDALAALVREAVAAGHEGAALDAASAMLRDAGIEPDPAGPRP